MRCGLHVALVAIVVGATAAAHAADPPCLADIQRWCSQVPDAGEILTGCLEQHRDDLSPECRKTLRTKPGREERVRDACGADADRLCGDIPLAGGENLACLVEHRESLSSRCREVLDEGATK